MNQRWLRAIAAWAAALLAAIGHAASPSPATLLRVGSPALPTIASALDAAMRARPALAAGVAITIVVPTGITRLAGPILIDAAHGGTARNPLVIEGASAATTRLVGAVPLLTRAATADDTGGRPFPAGTRVALLAPLPITANLVRRSAGLATPDGGLVLFQGGERLMPARWPDTGFAAVAARGSNREGPSLLVAPARIAAWAGEPAVWATGYWGADWSFERVPATVAGTALRLAPLATPEAIRPRVRFAIENALADLHAPGHFVVDPRRRIALYLPTESGGIVSAALAPTLLVLDGAHHVTVRGIAFDRTRGAAVRVWNAHDIRFEGCAFRQTGGGGIAVEGGARVTITRSVIASTAEGGVSLSGGDRATLTPGSLVFQDGIVADFGRDQPSYRPAVRLMGVGNAVRGSLLMGGDHSAVILSGNDQAVIGNEIRDVLRATDDAGAIYMGADWSQRGTVIAGNFIHALGGGRADASFLAGIYLDDQFSGALVADNVVVGGTFGMAIGGGRDNRLARNLIVHPRRGGLFFDARGLGWQRAMAPILAKRLAAVPAGGAEWRARYPALAALTPDRYGEPDGNLIADMAVVGAPVIVADPPPLAARLTTTANRALAGSVDQNAGGAGNDGEADAIRRIARQAGHSAPIADRETALAGLLPLLNVPAD